MASFSWPSTSSSTGGVPIYANFAAFPSGTEAGDLAVAADTGDLYEWTGSAWQLIASPGSAFSLGNFDAQSGTAKGAALTGGVLSMQSASATVPGLVNNTTQSLSGDKTFTGNITALNLSGTNTGDITLTAVGSSPSANAASLSSQVLTLQPADGTHPGVITSGTQTFGGNKTFSGTIGASNFSGSSSGSNTGDQTITLTSDVTGSGTGSFATTIAAGAVTLAKMANLAANSIIGNNTGSSATPLALTVSQVNTLLGTAPSVLTTLGDILYENATPAPARLAGNTTSTKNFLTQTGNGSISAAPAWGTIVAADVPNLAASKITSGTLATVRGGTNSDSSASTGLAQVSSGTWSYSNTVTSALSPTGGLVGSLGTGSASTGNIGEYVESLVTSATSMTAATTAFQDMTSISLTAGDWDVSLHVDLQDVSGTVTSMDIGISQTTGNSTTGLSFGVNRLEYPGPTTTADQGGTIANYRQLLTGTTTIYAKLSAGYNATVPKYRCRLSARRSGNTQG